MSAKALKYAETVLGVHSVYDQVTADLESLDGLLNELDKAQDSRRSLLEMIADREVDLLSDERGKHSDMSAAGMDQHMKVAKRKDFLLKDLRNQANQCQGSIQGLEYDVDLTKLRIRANSARMEELGGYLSYLAAVKQAEQVTKHNEPKE